MDLDEQAIRSMSQSERYRFIHDFSFVEMDTAAISATLNQMFLITSEQNDIRSRLVVNYRRYTERVPFIMADTSIAVWQRIFDNFQEMEQVGNEKGFEVEALIGHIYFTFAQFNFKLLPPEKMYVEAQQSFDKMQAIGFEKFKDYELEAIFYQWSHFMMQLEAYEEAYRFLTIAEHVIQPNGKNFKQYTLFLNYLQSYWQRKKDYPKTIGDAQKIILMYQ